MESSNAIYSHKPFIYYITYHCKPFDSGLSRTTFTVLRNAIGRLFAYKCICHYAVYHLRMYRVIGISIRHHISFSKETI